MLFRWLLFRRCAQLVENDSGNIIARFFNESDTEMHGTSDTASPSPATPSEQLNPVVLLEATVTIPAPPAPAGDAGAAAVVLPKEGAV